jgi:2-aminoadipate transaminase
MVEDDAYGELRFSDRSYPPFKKYLPDQTLLIGSFSKIVAPGMRLGWICAPQPVMDQLVVAKQASDLHSNYLSQRIASRYLADTDIDAHIRKIRGVYREQRDSMIAAMQNDMPKGVTWT